MNDTNNTIGDCLIVEDDQTVREALKLYCEKLKVFRTIVTAEDGSVAIKKLGKQHFSLILLDIAMPKKSGIQVLESIKKSEENSVDNVLIISGTLDQGALKQIVDMGVRDFLVKPFDQSLFQEKTRSKFRKMATT